MQLEYFFFISLTNLETYENERKAYTSIVKKIYIGVLII